MCFKIDNIANNLLHIIENTLPKKFQYRWSDYFFIHVLILYFHFIQKNLIEGNMNESCKKKTLLKNTNKITLGNT